MKLRLFAIPVLLLGLMATSASAQGKGGRGKPVASGRTSHVKVKPGSEAEIRIIREYYSADTRKPESLPPGIAKNLARGKPLPPGIAKKQVPDDLIILLPARPGARWLVAGDVVLLVDAGDIVVDLVRLVF
jgi:hypothetical protein